jgi:hypothetical protein
MLLVFEHMFERKERTMSIADFSDTVALWLHDGVPARLVWRDVRYTVTDQPTPLQVDADMFSAAVTHPPHSILGWRFQGTSEAGLSFVFDVRPRGGQRWEIVAVYE